MVFEYFELTGDRAIRYSFVVLDPKTNETEYKISLGSYDSTNDISHELGEIEKGKRLFHLDGYYPQGAHKTFGFYKGEPDYDPSRSDQDCSRRTERDFKHDTKPDWQPKNRTQTIIPNKSVHPIACSAALRVTLNVRP